MKNEKNKIEPEGRIFHFLLDGTPVDNIEGRVIPVTPETEGAYLVAYQVHQRLQQEEALKKNQTT